MKHKHKHSQMLIASVAFLSISGCTTPVYEGQYAWSQGWRVGKVTKLITADAFLEAGGSRCLMLPLFCGVLSSRLTRLFCAVPRTSVSRIA